MDPKELQYTRTDEWVAVEGDLLTLGITDQLAKKLSPVVYVELPEKGDDVLNDEPFGQIESVKDSAEIHSPVDGVVEEVNTELVGSPALLEDDPYEKGWIAKIRLDIPEQLEDLLSYSEYKNLPKRR